ncbi:MAG TPA: hypothetical protein ENJ27_00255 [Candidatus Moranbacteria bacterium]|nr:hypothetical protein [Candidatus Moranbacteria bacterium]
MRKENLIKISTLSILIVAVLALAGCQGKEESKTAVKNENRGTDKKVETVAGIKNMLKNGETIKCVSKDNDGEWVTYTNGKKFKGEGMQAGKKQNVLFTNDTTYTWDETTKTGQKMSKKCLEEFQKTIGSTSNTINPEVDKNFSVEKLETEEQSGKVNCSPATGINFSVPSDVNFTDQCEIMKQQMKGLNQQVQKMRGLEMK